MTKLNVAVIGVGNMGQHHVRNYSQMPKVNLVAVSDVNKKRGMDLAKRYDCLFYQDYKKMLAEQTIDAVSIAVPTSLHHQVTCDILDRGVNVLLEKPIATNLAEAKEMIDKTKEKSLTLMVGHIERFNPAIQKMKQLIVDNHLGHIISINIKRVGALHSQVKDTNVAIDLAIHDIDISNYLLGEYPKEVHSFTSKNLIRNKEDSAVILLKYSKSSSFLETNWVTPVKIRTMDVTGTKAFARLDYINQSILLYKNNYLKQKGQFKNFDEFISKFTITDKVEVDIHKKEPLRCELENFIDAIKNKKKPLMSGHEAYKALEIALKI